MRFGLIGKIIEFLEQNYEQKFTAREIAKWVFKNYPDECAAKKERSEYINSDAALIQQMVSEITASRFRMEKRNPQIKTTEERPRKYYFTNQTDQGEIEEAEATRDSSTTAQSDVEDLTERDLYPMLSSFLWAEYGIYSKRIDEKRSSNKRGPNGNKWLYPDLVGMEDLTSDWEQKIKDCVQQYSDKKTKLWSFEVKALINRSNVREAFFQAASNSSWANYGYLVATGLEGAGTEKELQILSALHGIGFILLDPKTPEESQVLIPARGRAEIDWDTANRLVHENEDFKNFVDEIIYFYQTGKTKASDWDVDED